MGEGKIIRLGKVDSTNLYALRNFAELAHGSLVAADEQTAGRGRCGRKWFSPPGLNLYATYVVKTVLSCPAAYSWLGALAALQTLRHYAPSAGFWIKWPNDILCGTRKIAGVLSEIHTRRNSNKPDGAAIGIGVNLNMDSSMLEKLGRPASSLAVETGKPTDVTEFIECLHGNLAALLDEAATAPDSFYERWKKENPLLGKKISVSMDNGQTITGTMVDILRDGRIALYSDGRIFKLSSGEVKVDGFAH